jgi:hypothetical protein
MYCDTERVLLLTSTNNTCIQEPESERSQNTLRALVTYAATLSAATVHSVE